MTEVQHLAMSIVVMKTTSSLLYLTELTWQSIVKRVYLKHVFKTTLCRSAKPNSIHMNGSTCTGMILTV